MKLHLLLVFIITVLSLQAQNDNRPNVLFIAIDDINDWVGPLNGNPQALTPHLDKFCQEGAVIFENAVTAAPICGPSRSALLTGFLPSTTGVYGNATNLIYTESFKENTTLPEYFSKYGYHSLSNGKIFHKHASGGEDYVDFGHWAFDEHARARRYVKDSAVKDKYTGAKAGIIDGVKDEKYSNKKAKLSWGPTKHKFEETVDYLVADWAKDALQRDFDQPFFMAVGIIKPHLPWFVPQEFFDMYNLDTITPPEVLESDLGDIMDNQGNPLHVPSPDYLWVKKHGLEKEATRAYLANISYADACLGHVFDALEESGHADNTIVVIWGDHGWHLGEKHRYLKNTLWAESAKTPFIIRMPGKQGASYCSRTVSLIDIYPTLNSLCGLPEKELDGQDISTLLENPKGKWERPGITVSTGGTSVMGERYHFISNLKGENEFYDLEKDPMEWDNLINDKKHKKMIEEMSQWVPKNRAVGPKEHHQKPKNYVDADADPRIKPTRDLTTLK